MAAYPKQPILIAYSGGIDSQVLLDCLATLKAKQQIQNPLHVCHVNHGLSSNALQWQHFALEQCKLRKIELTVCAVNIERENQQSLEALARDARYLALQNTANKLSEKDVVIITGHHQDDQLETFLLALKRGSGLKGLSAMNAVSLLGTHLLARPLLNCSRSDIEDHANEKQLTWIEDESNCDTRFDRNFLRQDIIPLLKQRWPSFAKTVSRSSALCRDGQQLVDELAQQDLKYCVLVNEKITEPALKVAELVQLSTTRFNNLLRYFIELHGYLMPSSAQLQQVQQQLVAAADKSPHVNLGDYGLRRFRDGLYLSKKIADLDKFSVQLNIKQLLGNETQVVDLPDQLGQLQFTLMTHGWVVDNINKKVSMFLTAPKDGEQINIHFNHDNPRCLPDYRQHHRSLKKILQELDIAPWQRKRIPFIYYNEELVAAVGYFVCQKFSPQKNQQQDIIKITWQKCHHC